MKYTRVSLHQLEQVHPYLPEAYKHLQQGSLTRREFVRWATLLGVSAGAALGCTSQSQTGSSQIIQRGGILRIGSQLEPLDHPARLDWVASSNVVRQVNEYLTETGPDNITRPHLLKNWTVSEDVKTWTLVLRQGIRFNNGDVLTATDVLFTINQWFDPSLNSSMRDLLAALGGPNNVEVLDDYTLRFHLKYPSIALPEHLFHFQAVILHRSFTGDFFKQPIGTGAFLLADRSSERVSLRRRSDYWRLGKDARPLPYLDEVAYIQMDRDTAVQKLKGRASDRDAIDMFFQPRAQDWQQLKDRSTLKTYAVQSSGAWIVRMRVDQDPWTDVRVRQALKLCQDREQIFKLAYLGAGELSIDAHVAPIHVSYVDQRLPRYDPEQAKALLTAAGYPDGIQVTLTTKNDEAEPAIARALQRMAQPAGIDIQLNIVDPEHYWSEWKDVNLGITAWHHRPLATIVLALGYTADAEGTPAAWNETRWVDPEFSSILTQAQSTLDLLQRRHYMEQLQTIMQERGPMGNSFWRMNWLMIRSEFENASAHPNGFDMVYEVWKRA